MIRFLRDPEKAGRVTDVHRLVQVVDLFMGYRRKMLKAIAKTASAQGRGTPINPWPALFEQCRIDPTVRPDRLSPETYVALANAVECGSPKMIVDWLNS